MKTGVKSLQATAYNGARLPQIFVSDAYYFQAFLETPLPNLPAHSTVMYCVCLRVMSGIFQRWLCKASLIITPPFGLHAPTCTSSQQQCRHCKYFHCKNTTTACPREIVPRGGHPLGLIEYIIERVYQVFFFIWTIWICNSSEKWGMGTPLKSCRLMKSKRWAHPMVARVYNRKSVPGFLPSELHKFLMKSKGWAPLKTFRLMKARRGHLFGLIQISKITKFV